MERQQYLESLKTIGTAAHQFGHSEAVKLITEKYREIQEQIKREKLPWEIN